MIFSWRQKKYFTSINSQAQYDMDLLAIWIKQNNENVIKIFWKDEKKDAKRK